VELSLLGVISIPRSGWVPFKIAFSAITGPESLSDALHCSRVHSRSSIRGRSNFSASSVGQRLQLDINLVRVLVGWDHV
jgi:hypothetical protein